MQPLHLLFAFLALLIPTTTALPPTPNPNLSLAPRNEETCGWLITPGGATQLMLSTPFCMNASEDEPFVLARNDYCAICYTFKNKKCEGGRTWWGTHREAVEVPIRQSWSYRCMY